MNENMNTNISNFAIELSKICGEHIDLDHIHEGSGRYYYIQPTEKGSPMLLRHYRGPLVVDIHKDDLKGLQSGELDAKEFIRSANWQVGYFWGGGSMIGGGYYQPIDIVNHAEDLQRYLRILSCRTTRNSSGYMPDEARCAKCAIENCPFSPYKEGSLKDEAIQENDPRKPLFRALTKKFESLYPGYTIHGWFSSLKDGGIPDKQAWVKANVHHREEDPYSFTILVNAETIRGLLMGEIVVEDADKFVEDYTFHYTELDEKGCSQVTLEHIQEIFAKDGMDYTKKKIEPKEEEIVTENKLKSFYGWIISLFKR